MPLNDIVRQRMQPLTSAFTANRIFLYGVFSTFATVATIANASRTYSNFYSVSVYLSRSGRSLLVLANFGFLLALLFGRILQRIFFGPLQAREVERLYDQTWMFVTESLLAFTIFRDDFDIPFVIMFGFLLFIKCFHWLMADRVESWFAFHSGLTMDQVPYPGPPVLFHIRFGSLFCILWTVDFIMLVLAIDNTLSNGVGGTVLFASEYAILMASAFNSLARYGLSSIELRRASTRGGANAPAWENKSMYIFYIELVTDFMKLATYLTFFVVVLTFYGLPLNIIRDVYITARSFITRLRALVRYHNATRDMDRRYPNASEEELTAMSDRTCIICREEMVAGSNNQNVPPPAENNGGNTTQAQDGPNVTPKKLPCGHIFHFQCLRSWLERQQSCPTCRRTVLETDQPNRGAARGARPPPPQPNAAPQPPQPGQLGQAAGNGPLGWLGRMMGAALQPPLAPGQLANGQLPPGFIPAGPQGMQQMPVNAGWPAPGQQLPPGYPYPYPYHMQPLPPQHLQPPPVYRGFYGPDNVWHPWGVDGQWQPQVPQTPGTANQPNPEGSQASTQVPLTNPSHGGSGSSQNVDQSVPTRTRPEATQDSAPSTGPDEVSQPISATNAGSSSEGDHSLTPRAAASLAALRRLGLAEPSGLSNSSTPSDSQPPADVLNSSTTSAESRSVNESLDVASHAPASGGSGPTPFENGESPNSSTTHQQQPITDAHPQAPPLIPLYDLTNPQQLPPFPTNPQAIQYYQQQLAAQRYAFRGTTQPLQGYRVLQSSGAQPRHRQQGPRAPLSQLPQTLTDEQLARLDRLTRDAIDERLRVLEGVSSAVYRCVEELTRIRSVLPAREEVGSTMQVPTPLNGTEQGAPSAASATTSDSNAGTESQGPQPPGTVTPKAPAVDLPPSDGPSSAASDGAADNGQEPTLPDTLPAE